MTPDSMHGKLWRALMIGGVFLCMQMAAVTHAAAHGDATHSHDGAPCLIQIISETPSHGVAVTDGDAGPLFLLTHGFPARRLAVPPTHGDAHPIRAPPGFSL